jgi:hypothetical protein
MPSVFSVDYNQPTITQEGLSGGDPVSLPSTGAYWRRPLLQPQSLCSQNPVLDECQIWPQYGITQSGIPA